MATIKSYTDIEQSRKLEEILPLESADTHYWRKDQILGVGHSKEMQEGFKSKGIDYNPCWSLAALLGVLPDYTLQTAADGKVFIVCESKKPMISDAYDNPVDACYELILKLNELKML